MMTSPLPECGGSLCPGVVMPAGRRFTAIVDPATITIILVSEAEPLDPGDGYYAPGDPLFARTTVAAFSDAGLAVASIADIVRHGVYLTTAVRCPKVGYAIEPAVIRACAPRLARDIERFPNAGVLLLMGDVAIRSINEIARRDGTRRVVPAGATYRIRSGDYRFRGIHVLPSYLQAGPAFFIEKSKRRMIAEDIRRAFELSRPVPPEPALHV